MAGVFQFTCVQLDGFHSSLLIVFFPYTEDYPRSQHLVLRPTVFSTHCLRATNVYLIPASADDEAYHMPDHFPIAYVPKAERLLPYYLPTLGIEVSFQQELVGTGDVSKCTL